MQVSILSFMNFKRFPSSSSDASDELNCWRDVTKWKTDLIWIKFLKKYKVQNMSQMKRESLPENTLNMLLKTNVTLETACGEKNLIKGPWVTFPELSVV